MTKRSWTTEDLLKAVKESTNLADVMRKLNIKPYGGNYIYIKKEIVDLNIFLGLKLVVIMHLFL